jgi:hypothetical protein
LDIPGNSPGQRERPTYSIHISYISDGKNI